MYLRVDDVPLVLIPVTEEPREVHCYTQDRGVRRKSGLSEPLGWLPLSGVAGDGYAREAQPSRPESRAEIFVFRHRGHGRLV